MKSSARDYRYGNKSRMFASSKRKKRGKRRRRPTQKETADENNANKESCLKCQQDGCGKRFLDQKALDWHFDRVHKEVVPTVCDWQNCGKSFRTAEAAEAHIKSHYKKTPHKCSKCEQGFDKFEDIKAHFLQTHTKWKEGESSTNYELPNISNKTETNIDKESTSSEPKASDLKPSDLRSWSFTPNASDNDDSSSDGVDFESFFENSKLKTQKVEITYECDWKNCGKCFDTTGALEKHKKTHLLEKHKKTHLVDKDTASEKCTKCDARFDSFELVKIHFLETHTKWKKEEALNEDKDSENITIVKKYASNECKIAAKVENQGNNTKKKTKNDNSINILNRRQTDKIFSAITTKARVKDVTPEDKDTILNKKQKSKDKNTELNNKKSGSKSTLNQKQPVPNPNNIYIADDPKNTFVLYSDKAIDDSNKPKFYIVNAKPNLENPTIGPSRQIFQLVAKNTATNVPNNINQASCSSFTEHEKFAMSYTQNLMPDLSSTSNFGNIMPLVGNTTSIFANAKPVVGQMTSNLANVPVVGKITPNLPNVPVVGNLTPNLPNVPVVGSFTPNLANVPVVGNLTPNLASVTPDMERDTPDLANAIIPAEGNITPSLATFMSNMKTTTSYFAEELPVRVNIIPKAAKPNLGKYISPDVANTISDAKTITSNEINKPEVSKINSMLANIIPIVRNLSNNTPNHGLLKVDHSFCQCSNCLDSSEHTINGKRVHRCDSCGGIFMTKNRLDKHMKKHTEAEPYFCPFKCGRRFSSKDARTRHMRVHTKLEIFVCEICQKGFIRQDLLKKHTTIHDKHAAATQAKADDDNLENNLSKENTDDNIMGNSEGDAIEMSDDDDSEAEDNGKNSTSESSDENDSSEEENITNDNVEAPSLVEDEVCLDLGENIDNTTTDPLSGITNFEDMFVPLPQIIKREEETTEHMPSTLINIAEENMEILPVQIINTGEDSLECIPLERTETVYDGKKLVTEQVINTEESEEPMIQTVNIRKDSILETGLEFMPLNGIYGGVESISEIEINAEKCIEPITQAENIREYSIELMPLKSIKSEQEGIEPIFDHVINTEDHVLSTPTQILHTEENSMEFTPLEIIKREDEEIDPVSEQLIITEEESIDLIPAKRIKREEDNINYILGQGINVEDATLALRSLEGNKILRVGLERLPLDF